MSEQLIRSFRDESVTPVYRRWICGKDGCTGEMKPTGTTLMVYPAQYPHCCDVCSRNESATTIYPRIAYLPIEAVETALK